MLKPADPVVVATRRAGTAFEVRGVRRMPLGRKKVVRAATRSSEVDDIRKVLQLLVLRQRQR